MLMRGKIPTLLNTQTPCPPRNDVPVNQRTDSISETSSSPYLGNECDQLCNVSELNHGSIPGTIAIDLSQNAKETEIHIADQVALLTHFEREPAAPNKGSFGWRRTALDVGGPCVEATGR
jgi:hypothetical protein